jgi:hypothetical protein
MELQNIKVLANADDIACICNTITQAKQAISAMKSWAIVNRMEVNQNNSGILRILSRTGCIGIIPNALNIPEVLSYQYLGIKI